MDLLGLAPNEWPLSAEEYEASHSPSILSNRDEEGDDAANIYSDAEEGVDDEAQVLGDGAPLQPNGDEEWEDGANVWVDAEGDPPEDNDRMGYPSDSYYVYRDTDREDEEVQATLPTTQQKRQS